MKVTFVVRAVIGLTLMICAAGCGPKEEVPTPPPAGAATPAAPAGSTPASQKLLEEDSAAAKRPL